MFGARKFDLAPFGFVSFSLYNNNFIQSLTLNRFLHIHETERDEDIFTCVWAVNEFEHIQSLSLSGVCSRTRQNVNQMFTKKAKKIVYEKKQKISTLQIKVTSDL